MTEKDGITRFRGTDAPGRLRRSVQVADEHGDDSAERRARIAG
jgi:hypothetical protein